MGLVFAQRSGIERQVREIACEQVTKALAECEAPHADFDKLVHSLRRRCKKLRGLLRLIEPRFKHAKREDGAFRDAAAGLSVRRDAAVMVGTFSTLVDFDRDRDGRIAAVQAEKLMGALRSGTAATPDKAEVNTLLEAFVDIFEWARARADGWQLSGRGFNQIGEGLEDTYRRMRNGLSTAASEGTAEALHDWRKNTKYHWHHVGLLYGAAPDILGPRKASLDRLGELLGDHHNLAVLDEALTGWEDIANIRAVITQRQAMLASGAFELGRQLVAERPGMLRDRFKQYWSLLPEKS